MSSPLRQRHRGSRATSALADRGLCLPRRWERNRASQPGSGLFPSGIAIGIAANATRRAKTVEMVGPDAAMMPGEGSLLGPQEARCAACDRTCPSFATRRLWHSASTKNLPLTPQEGVSDTFTPRLTPVFASFQSVPKVANDPCFLGVFVRFRVFVEPCNFV